MPINILEVYEFTQNLGKREVGKSTKTVLVVLANCKLKINFQQLKGVDTLI